MKEKLTSPVMNLPAGTEVEVLKRLKHTAIIKFGDLDISVPLSALPGEAPVEAKPEPKQEKPEPKQEKPEPKQAKPESQPKKVKPTVESKPVKKKKSK